MTGPFLSRVPTSTVTPVAFSKTIGGARSPTLAMVPEIRMHGEVAHGGVKRMEEIQQRGRSSSRSEARHCCRERGRQRISAPQQGEAAQMMGFRAMNEESVYQADAEDIPSEVSDEALETAAGNEALPAWTNICSASAAGPG
jgi:hypothetical protein